MTAITYRRTLADSLPLPQARWRSAVLVVGVALLTAAAAQVEIPLGWTPVPVTGQTFAVLLGGAALGAGRGALSQLTYIALGAVGLPFFAGGEGGWQNATGATAGYLAGFVLAAALVGWAAERGQDRHLLSSVEAMIAGNAVIYVAGVAWLAHHLDVSMSKAVELGMAPFVLGDVLKIALAGMVLPSAWRLIRRTEEE